MHAHVKCYDLQEPANSPYSPSPLTKQFRAFEFLVKAVIGNHRADQTRPIYLAAEAIRACRDPRERDALLRELAIKQAVQGFHGNARDTAALIDDPRVRRTCFGNESFGRSGVVGPGCTCTSLFVLEEWNDR